MQYGLRSCAEWAVETIEELGFQDDTITHSVESCQYARMLCQLGWSHLSVFMWYRNTLNLPFLKCFCTYSCVIKSSKYMIFRHDIEVMYSLTASRALENKCVTLYHNSDAFWSRFQRHGGLYLRLWPLLLDMIHEKWLLMPLWTACKQFLNQIVPSGQSYSGMYSGIVVHSIFWIYPVIQALSDLRSHLWVTILTSLLSVLIHYNCL